ncbi:hypothetical protein V6N12_013792 [Hibiscus sabdariffa]|uniref:Uncharacterized protein n=1 Tax=Hibiscus sabdariffa TaxID=183260 RepID=A0ABR2CXV1_9ROSI
MLSILSILSTLLSVFALVLRTVSLPIEGLAVVAAVFCAASDPSMSRVLPFSWLTLMVNLFGHRFQAVQGLGLDSPWLTGLSMWRPVLTISDRLWLPHRHLHCHSTADAWLWPHRRPPSKIGPLRRSLFTANLVFFPSCSLNLTIVFVLGWQDCTNRCLWAGRDSHLPPKRFGLLPDMSERLSVALLDSGNRNSVGSGIHTKSGGNPVAPLDRSTQLCDGSWTGLHRALLILGQRHGLLKAHEWASFLGWCCIHLGDLLPWSLVSRSLDRLFFAFFSFLDCPSPRDSLGPLDRLINWVSFIWVTPGLADPFMTRTLFNSPLDVHGLYFWRHLTAWSTQRASPWSICYSSLSQLPPFSLLMDSKLIYSMENLQFTAAESESIVVEPPCEAGDSGLWLVGSVISNMAVDGDSVCRIFRSV